MKTIKYLASAVTAALLALGSPLAASAANGHIFDILPSDEFGGIISGPVASANDPLGGGEKVNFVVRMMKADMSSTSTKWHLKHIGLNSEAVDAALNPFGIGIFVSGEIRIATLKSVLSTGDYFSDFVFEYVTRPGDFALPIVLANKDGKPASDAEVNTLEYYISPAARGVWTIADEAGATANFWFCPSTPPYPTGSISEQDYSMRNAGFYVRTVDFDSNYEDPANGIWRTVHEDSTVPGGATPSIEVTGLPTNSVTLYVWSLNETGVEMANGTRRPIKMDDGSVVERTVQEIKIVAGKLQYPFEIKGKSQNEYDYLVLSAFPNFNYHDGSGTPLKDYLTVKVQCSEPLPPSVRVAPVDKVVTANSNYSHYVTELKVEFTQAFTEDVEIKITPSLSSDSAANWSDYIRFSDSQDFTSLPAADEPKVTIKAGKLAPETKLYVFALRSDAKTVGTGNYIQFKADTDNAAAKQPGAIKDWGIVQGDMSIEAQGPVITVPVEGDSSLTAVAGAARTLRISVSDTYADQVSDAGYEIWVLKNSDTESSFTKLDGTYKTGQGGYLYKVDSTDELPSVIYSETGVNKSTIYVKSPVSGSQSAERNFVCTVTAPAGFTVMAIDGKTNNEYKEGDDVSVEITLDRQNTTGGSLYAFLVPSSVAASNAVDCAFMAKPDSIGLEIPQYGTSVAGFFTLVDGRTGAANSQFSYKIQLRTAAVYQDGVPVTSFMCKNTLGLKSTNVIPSVESVLMGLNETNDEGKFEGIVVAKDVEQTFTVNLNEPGRFDLEATGDDEFQVKWLFKMDGVSASGPANEDVANTGIIKGNPEEDENKAKFTFRRAGKWTVTVELRDKDMSSFGNGELKGKYTFEVEVVDQPAITVTGRTESGDKTSSFYEIEALDAGGGAYIDINLAMNKCYFETVVELVVASGDPASLTQGKFELQESANVEKKSDNVYWIKFPAGETTVSAVIKTLDGTVTSRTQGFVLTPTMLTTDEVPETNGKPANSYYVGTPATLKVNNSVPQVDEADLYPLPGTTNFVAIGAADPITWNFTDVLSDFEGGITVTVKGGGGFTEQVTTLAGAAGTFTPTFTASGSQSVQLTIKDKDNGQISYTWYYEVEVAKTLALIPHGPAGGNGTANSKRYRTAAGLGEGRVWASGFSNVEYFRSSYNCGKSAEWQVYAYGYKVGEVDDGVNLKKYVSRSIPINASGNAKGAAEAGFAYTSVYDSFLYTWLQVVRSEEGGALTDMVFGEATSPEYTELTDSGTIVGLPSEQNEDGSYSSTMLEAIFSREYLVSDNMGDINQDGIPDIYVDKYGMGVVDPATGKLVGDDLVSLRGFNEDADAPDFLPASSTSGYGTLIPGLEDSWATLGQPFTAFLEIRGYAPGLNDAPALAGIPNVKPDRVYTDPDLDEESTLSKVEYLAWTEFAAANDITDLSDKTKWTLWSPERPTDPGKADTDEDGFSDGYEYYFWYRAHVGYMEGGNHRYLTGRAYDPRNPGEGRLITAAEIAALMDPITPSGDASSAATRDIDNDGLPDLLEFMLGTNPFEFDTDGDGLPDGWELMIAGTSPVAASSHLDAMIDTTRNYDGDAMAFTTQMREMTELPKPLKETVITTFAVIDGNGDTDGKQWYALKQDAAASLTLALDESATGTLLSIGGSKYICAGAVKVTTDNRLASAYVEAYAVTNAADVAEDVPGITKDYLRLAPVLLEAGLQLDAPPQEKVGYAVATVATAPEANASNAAWVYGSAKIADYGMLAVGRHAAPEVDAVICEIPSTKREVAYLHYLVYQEYGFDPRTAWSPNSPMTPRWGKTSADGEAVEGVTVMKQGGYASKAARTRAYAMYDEFLVYSFFLNNGVDMTGITYVTDPAAPLWASLWGAFTTNPQGPGEPEAIAGDNYYGRNSVEGADTDLDGVPDGWELYVMAGPKNKDGTYVFAPPYAGFATALSTDSENTYVTETSHWSPFVSDADSNKTDSQLYLGGQGNSDGLTQRREFGGTDSCAHYAECSTTIVRHESDLKWLNKFFPTDPWKLDTDGDGISDSAEGTSFVYGSPADNGKLWSIPGGGLNPCSVDTDLDGLPDTWENQYKGSTVYAGEDATYASDIIGEAGKGNPLEGYVDGMDGTVPDAYSVPNNLTVINSDGRRLSGKVNRDYDRDGLENWQEYLTGTMRCWRYDDPISPWTSIPKEAYFVYDDAEEEWIFSAENAAKTLLGDETKTDEFWYRTLVDKTSPIYNPNLVVDCSPGVQYFSRVTNVWDTAYLDNDLGGVSGAYYYFAATINGEKVGELWGKANGLDKAPGTLKYVGCNPLKADSDQDGMDDYYELFHGMNPLLGESGVEVASNGPCDLVADAWTVEGEPLLEAWTDDLEANFWTRQVKGGNYYRTGAAPKGNGYDFEYYPWLNGAAGADPDGDDIRNQQESIMPVANVNAKHTDPTPLWMTDSSYSNSIVRMFFKMPVRFEDVVLSGDSFANPDDPEEKFEFMDFPGFVPANPDRMEPAKFAPFSPDFWQLASAGEENWMFSFEENEGYDTDHDGMSDNDESVARFRDASDPLDQDSPRRRQAMYFAGKAKPSLLQTLPFEKERHPIATDTYPESIDFCQFTVECWVKAESLENSTVIERAVRVAKSNPGDQKYVRRNFHLGIRDGKWYAAYDSAGTLATASTVEAVGYAATADWTHLAATYDGRSLNFYINGVLAQTTLSSVDPEYGASALAIEDLREFWGERTYDLVATIVGASVKSGDDGKYGAALALTSANAVSFTGLSAYENFFQGWIDEVRIWDGARTSDEVAETFKVRFSAEDAAANREAVFNEWKDGNRRYVVGNTARAELRYHYAFDSIFGALTDRAGDLRCTPQGFNDSSRAKPALSRPADWRLGWLADIYDAHGGSYGNYLWANWIPNTVTHLPRFDGTTLDSMYWSKEFAGWDLGSYGFPMSAEPYSKWTQMKYNQAATAASGKVGTFATPGARYQNLYGNPAAQGYDAGSNGTFKVDYIARFEFTGRYLNQQGDDMLPLGGAYAKYVETMWDDNGPSAPWEFTGNDSSLDGIPEWWQEYAAEFYNDSNRYGDMAQINWDSIVDWKDRNGQTVQITAREAYWRDLAAGLMLEKGVPVFKDGFEQVADVNGDGLADWWENMFGISAAKIGDDTDNDALADFAEYLVSETFKFAAVNPTMPRTDGVRLDYFGKIGSLYFGEILSDHDFMEDWWESLYNVKNVSAGVYDAHADGDNDGWSNFAESRAGTSPDRISYLGVDESTMNDFPVPVVKLTCSYRGAQNAAVYPVVVKAYSKKSNSSMPDAVWKIDALVGDAGGEEAGNANGGGASSGSGEEAENASGATREKHFGMNPGTVVKFNLGPGSVVVGSVTVNFKDLTWETETLYNSTVVDKVIGDSAQAVWCKAVIDQVRAGDTVYGDLIISYADATSADARIKVGEINYQTGEGSIDFSKLQERFWWERTDSLVTENGVVWQTRKCAELSRSYVRIDWASKQTTTGYPKTFFLADAELNSAEKPSQGHLYEGVNWFEAFVDMDGDGHYSAGEPYGFKRGVDIGWSGTEFNIELTDTNPVFARLRFNGADCSCDRVAIYGSEAAVEVKSNSVSSVSGGKIDRVRIVRVGVNDITLPDNEKSVVRDFKVNFDLRPYLTEADILGDGNFDVEALGLFSTYNGLTINKIKYAVVFGDDPLSTELVNNRLAPFISIRRFDTNRLSPSIVSGGKQTVFYGAKPSFTWTMNGFETYSAFQLQVRDTSGKTVYDSGMRLTPELDADGNYSWTPDDLFVDDQCFDGTAVTANGGGVAVFANAKQYTWRVRMHNIKFGNDNTGWSANAPQFRMNVNVASEANDAGYSCIKAAVKYFGPQEVLGGLLHPGAAGKIRVEAFTSPDFTGTPVARGYFAGSSAILGSDDYSANVVLKGIPAGSYYLRAFVDINGNFKRDAWESWGYANRRDMTSGRNVFTPVPVTVGRDVAAAPLVRIYIEDTDTDGDWLPDAWEMATGGSLTAKGPGEFFDANVFRFQNDFQKRFTRVSASGSPLASSLGALSADTLSSSDMAALLLGVNTAGYSSSAAALSASIAPELVENGVTIESLEIKDGKVVIKVAGKTATALSATASPLYSVTAPTTLSVTCNVYVKETLADEKWTLAVSRTVTVGGEAAEMEVGKGGGSGFYKVELEK